MATYNGNTDLSKVKLVNGDIINFDYSGQVKSLTLLAGEYKLECWGAQGGSTTVAGAKGGYSSGVLDTDSEITLYLATGQLGPSNSNVGGWNGGGGTVNNSTRSGGGGASHISTAKGLLTETAVRTGILLVAGAGGGAGSPSTNIGGEGGGLSGVDAPGNTSYPAKGGTQNSGGNGGNNNNTTTAGGPGYGGKGHGNSGGGGGSGWYGGGGGWNNRGAGGSSHYSSKLKNPSTLTGAQSMPNPRGSGNIVGNTGNGFIRITVIKCNSAKLIIEDNNDLLVHGGGYLAESRLTSSMVTSERRSSK